MPFCFIAGEGAVINCFEDFDGVPSKEIHTLEEYKITMGVGVVGQNTTYHAR